MRNIRKFETFEDFLASQESVSGSGKYVQDIWPGFAYIKENFPEAEYAVYNGEDSEEYEFGDIIYYDGSDKLKKVYWSAFTPSMGEKVGLVVVPTALAPDGNARIMAFGSIVQSGSTTPTELPVVSAAKPGDGDVILGEKTAATSYDKVYASWYDNFMDENQTVYTCVPGFYLEGDGGDKKEGGVLSKASVPGSEGQPTHYESPISLPGYSENYSNFSSDAHYMYPNPYTNGEYYNTGDTLVAISPFLGDSLKEQDPAYLQEELEGGSLPSGDFDETESRGISLGGGNYNAFSDFSGYTWTYGCPPERENEEEESRGNMKSSKPVGPVLGAYFPHNYARLFHTDGTQAGDWYLPSMGEMGFFVARYKMIVEEIMPYLFSIGAWATDGSDNIPGIDNTGESQYSYGLLWVSTVGARSGGVGPIYNEAQSVSPALLGASIPGYDTYPTIYPMVATVLTQHLIGEDEGGVVVKASNPNVLGATSNQFRYNISIALNYYGGGVKAQAAENSYEILPFAMIKEGKIQRTMGDYTAANGHQVKDFYADNPKD